MGIGCETAMKNGAPGELPDLPTPASVMRQDSRRLIPVGWSVHFHMATSPQPRATRGQIESVLRCVAPAGRPLFLPAIYEHKASFIGSTPSAISRDANLLTRAMLAEFEAVGADAL